MRFEEIELYEAIHDVVEQMKENNDSPGSDIWLVQDSELLCRMIQGRLPIGAPFTKSEMMFAWTAYRKSADKKLAVQIRVGRLHGKRCFWRDRGLGECSDEASIDRIVTGSRGGTYVVENCVISCSRHNGQRGNKTVEEFILRSNAEVCNPIGANV